jgi:hypothetical protein
LRQAGRLAEADQLEEQLNRLLEKAPQMEQLEQLADQLGRCSKCLRDGQMQEAGDALEKLQAGMENLQEQLEELELIDEAMDQLAQTREQMNCPFCGGAGCENCQGPPGQGLGAGRGQGARPEAETDSSFYDSQVRQKIGRGTAVVTDLVDGPNVKGDAEEAIQQQFDSARRGSTDPLTGRRMPRKHRQHARQYFDRFREGD